MLQYATLALKRAKDSLTYIIQTIINDRSELRNVLLFGRMYSNKQ